MWFVPMRGFVQLQWTSLPFFEDFPIILSIIIIFQFYLHSRNNVKRGKKSKNKRLPPHQQVRATSGDEEPVETDSNLDDSNGNISDADSNISYQSNRSSSRSSEPSTSMMNMESEDIYPNAVSDNHDKYFLSIHLIIILFYISGSFFWWIGISSGGNGDNRSSWLWTCCRV